MLAGGYTVQNAKVSNTLRRCEELRVGTETNKTYALVDSEDGLYLGIRHGIE